MTQLRPPAPPSSRAITRSLRGLDDGRADRPSGEVLRDVPWEGPAPDPERLTAEELLAFL